MNKAGAPKRMEVNAKPEHDTPSVGAEKHPKYLGFMVGWLVFLGFYQIFLAWRFGTFFEGTHGDVRKYYGGGALEPLYAAIGILALIVAWGGWKLRPWAYRLAFVFQGLVFIVIIGGIAFRIAGKPAPLGWLLLDTVFGVCNMWWLLTPETRRAFAKDQTPSPRPVSHG